MDETSHPAATTKPKSSERALALSLGLLLPLALGGCSPVASPNQEILLSDTGVTSQEERALAAAARLKADQEAAEKRAAQLAEEESNYQKAMAKYSGMTDDEYFDVRKKEIAADSALLVSKGKRLVEKQKALQSLADAETSTIQTLLLAYPGMYESIVAKAGQPNRIEYIFTYTLPIDDPTNKLSLKDYFSAVAPLLRSTTLKSMNDAGIRSPRVTYKVLNADGSLIYSGTVE